MPVLASESDRGVLRQRIAARLHWQTQAHDPVRDPRNKLPAVLALRSWQTRRLRASFADFLDDKITRPAAEFFLSDLYSDRDFSARDRDVALVMPLMSRILPPTLLVAAAEAIELATLSHGLDLRMAQASGASVKTIDDISVASYTAAYRAVGFPRLRRYQIALIVRVGRALDAAVQRHGVHSILRASRLPARAAGLSELQGFLERGFDAFAKLDDASAFLDRIAGQELRVSEKLFAGDPKPFE